MATTPGTNGNADLGEFFRQPAGSNDGVGLASHFNTPAPAPEPAPTGKLASPVLGADVDAILAQEGAAHLKPIVAALYGQESGGGANATTSVDGARGGMQVIPATFARMAKPGEDINNPADNMRVGIRYIKLLADKSGNDPAKIAAGYFSGEGNIGTDRAYKIDHADGNGKHVSSYVSEVMRRIGNPAPAGPEAPGLAAKPQAAAPKWGDIASKPEYAALTPEQKKEARDVYFNRYVAPQVGDQAPAYRAKFDASADQWDEKINPGIGTRLIDGAKQLGGQIVEGAKGLGSQIADAFGPEKGVMERIPSTTTPGREIPVLPEYKRAVTADWNAATPEQRVQMANARGPRGYIARQLNDQYAQTAAPAPVADTLGLKDKSITGQMADVNREFDRNKATDFLDPRAEARTRQLIRNGMNADDAKGLGRDSAYRDITPGQEKGMGRAEATDFDFAVRKQYNEDPFFKHPLVRAAVKGFEGYKQGIAGLNQLGAEVLGADELAGNLAGMNAGSRNKADSIGESNNYGQRMFEGAVSSIATQLPGLIGGAATGTEVVPLASMFLQTLGTEYSSGRAQGQDQKQALERASLYATFEVLGEKFGMGNTVKALRGIGTGMATKDVATQMAKALLKEIPGEEFTTLGQFATDKMANGVGLNTEAGLAEYLDQAKDTLVQTVIQGGLMTGGASAVSAGAHAVKHGMERAEINRGAKDIAAEINRQVDEVNYTGIDAAARGALDPNNEAIDPAAPRGKPDTGAAPAAEASPVEPKAPAAPAGAAAATPETPTPEAPLAQPAALADQDMLDYADARARQLQLKRDGEEIGDDAKGTGLTAEESIELSGLEAAKGDPVAIGKLYGVDRTAPTKDAVDEAAHTAATSPKNDLAEPTDAQKEAGNYAKGHVNVHGLDISIENPEGSTRSGTSPDGKEWSNTLANHYGYIRRTEGADGDHVDTFVGPNPQSTKVFVVDQIDPATGKFDEHKVMLGFDSQEEADKAYHANYEKGWTGAGAIAETSIDDFKGWLKEGDTTKPFAEQQDGRVPEAKPAALDNTPAPTEAQIGLPPDVETLVARAIKEQGIKPGGARGENYRQGIIDAAEGKEPQRASNSYIEGHNWALGELGKAPKVEPKPRTEKAAKAKKATKKESTNVVEAPQAQQTEAQGPEESAGPVAAPKTEKQEQDFNKKQIPDMTDAELQQARAFYGKDHKRTPKIEKEIKRRAAATWEEPAAPAPAADDLDAMFDQVLAEETAARPAAEEAPQAKKAPPVKKKPRTEKESKAQRDAQLADYFAPGNVVKSYSGHDRVVSYAPGKDGGFSVTVQAVEQKDGAWAAAPGAAERTHSTMPDARLLKAGPVAVASESTPPAQRSTAEAAISAAKNSAKGLSDAIDGLGKLFGGNGTLGSGPVFNDETYAKAKPHFQSAVQHINMAGADIKEVMRAVVRMVLDKFGAQAAANMKPYVVRFAQEYQAAAAPAATLVDLLTDRIRANQMPADNPALRKLVAEFDKAEVSNARLKEAQEAVEAAITRVARDVVAKKEGDRTTFDVLLRLYESQPNLNIRTTTSIENQAYSTPAPLAFLAARLAGIDQNTKVLEPTAGTGMLLITANPANAITNELDPKRAALLRAEGFKPTEKNAVETLTQEPVDAVITNPPFGSLKDAAGNPTKVSLSGYQIGQIDHLIAARALETMKDDGKATLILGANKIAGGVSKDDRIFLNWLYGHYNVTSHFEVEGKLYTRQGAAWPIRVITIDGRKLSKQVGPQEGTIARAMNWSEVYEQYLGAKNAADGRGKGRIDRAGEAGPGNESEPISQPDGAKAGGTDASGPAGSTPGAGNVGGPGAGTGSNSESVQPDGVAEPSNAIGRDAATVDADRLVEGEQASGTPAGAGTSEPTGNSRTDRVKKEGENEFQAAYVPRSARKDEGVLIPVNMRDATQDALSRLEDQVGNIDNFAAKELGYKNTDELHNALMGLQVDSVATAIHQIKNGKGVVIADQTGIGKGRQAAAMIRWAQRQGYVPVFVTVKPQLFTDMYGDLKDIGTTDIAPFIMNTDESISDANGDKMFVNKKSSHRATLAKIAETGQLPEGSNALFMTYSQINTDNIQRKAVTALSDKAVFILDESHNAGGASSTGEFVTGALAPAKGVVYLSATFAKRPDNMPLYFKTDIGEAISDDGALMDAMLAGGLPLQTVVSNNLVKSGQMFRRERSYDGVSIVTNVAEGQRAEHEKLSDSVTEALRSIVSADRTFHEVYFKELAKRVKEAGGAMHDIAGNQAQESVNHTEFSSVVHNFVRQLLLGLKADTAAAQAIKALKEGKKPLIAVENTMGSFLNEYASANNIQVDAPLGKFDYRNVLSRALERSRHVVQEDAKGNKEKKFVKLADLDPITRNAYDKAQRVIDKLDLDIPVSPIDWMRHKIKEAGYTVAEITGRDLTVNYTNPKNPTLSQLSAEEKKDKVGTTRLFNNGQLDAIILNVAGSTGISLHASERFTDQRPRHMIVAQAAQDINIFMQMLGRIHRTGQVVLPSYEILNVDLPAEKRPTALLSKKMKSLNANTSANSESATSVKAADMMNKYGDQVVGQYLEDNLELAAALGLSTSMNSDGEAEEDIARKATGRLALMPVEWQKTAYADLEDQYATLIEYLNKTNQNELEPRTFDFDAKEGKQQTLFEGKNKKSPFGADAIYNEMSIKAQGIPMTPTEIRAAVTENTSGKSVGEHSNAIINQMRADYKAFHAQKMAETLAAGIEVAPGEWTGEPNSKNREVEYFIRTHSIGDMHRVEINGDVYNAIVTNIKSTHKGKGNPYLLSKLQVTVAVNGALRSVTVPASQFKKIEVTALGGSRLESLFDSKPKNERDMAKIITGNLLSAYGELRATRGTIINFTRGDGTVEQGILLPKKFDYKMNTQGDFHLRSAEVAYKFLMNSKNEDISRIGIASRDNTVRVTQDGTGRITIIVPKSKARGGKFFLDSRLTGVTGDFVSAGNSMLVSVPAGKAVKALDVLMDKTALYSAPSMMEEARSIVGVEHNDISSLAVGGPLARLNDTLRQETLNKLRSLQVKRTSGAITDSEFSLASAELMKQIQQRNTPAGPVNRGVEAVRATIADARAKGAMGEHVADFALWALEQNPNLAQDLAITINDTSTGSAGSYRSAERIITMFADGSNPGTAVHEILHHSERMMSQDVQNGIAREWFKAYDRAWVAADAKVRTALESLLRGGAGDKVEFAKAIEAFADGTLQYDKHYQFSNASEFWAVNATDIMAKRYAVRGTWVGKAKQWLTEMLERVKGILGAASQAEVLRGLDAVLNGDGTLQTPQMLSQLGLVEDMGANEVVHDITRTARSQLAAEFGKPKYRNVDWWDKSVGTMLNFALKEPTFKKVFDLMLDRENIISLTSLRPASLAPAFLPRVNEFKSAVRTLVKGQRVDKQMAGAADAVLEGTLAGESVIQGKVWTDSELRARGLDDRGIMLYWQQRHAIDASLEELAAAEGYAALQFLVPSTVRALVIESPAGAETILTKAIDRRIAMDTQMLAVARNAHKSEERIAELEQALKDSQKAKETVEKIFEHVELLQGAGYAPLMRFGEYKVLAEMVDPLTGKTMLDEEGNTITLDFQRFETEAEATVEYYRLKQQHRDNPSVRVTSGTVNDIKYKMYEGISAETLALFAEVVGADSATKALYQEAVSERSALKRRLERKAIPGFSKDMPRVLANFITSNGRFAGARYYSRDVMAAIKYIPREKADVQKQAQLLAEYVNNPGDKGASASSLAFIYFLGGNISSAVTNLTQPVLQTFPHLTRFGSAAQVAAAMARAVPYAVGKKQIADPALRAALKKASQEGKVDAQEIFHLYSVGIKGVSASVANLLSKVPGANGFAKQGTQDIMARLSALGTIWGMPFALAEGFNRRLTFIAAWDMAQKNGEANPYRFATQAVDETQGIYNKVNRPALARSAVGRLLFTFAQFKISYVEMLKRSMKGGPAGRKAAAIQLALLILASGLAGVPYADDVDDIIDTVGQVMGLDTNMKRTKRDWAHKTLGEAWGDMALYGVSARLPMDMSGRLGFGNMLPATGIAKPSNAENRGREFMELAGPAVGGVGAQIMDAYDAAAMGNYGQAGRSIAPTAIKNALAGAKMAQQGYATNTKGQKSVDVTNGDAFWKAMGFNPTVVAQNTREKMPMYQDKALHKVVKASLTQAVASAIVEKDQEKIQAALERAQEWNKRNPKMLINVTPNAVKARVGSMMQDANTRTMRSTPKELRAGVAERMNGGDDD